MQPITCGMVSTPRFDFNYTKGIISEPIKQGTEMDHEVEVIGWGVSKGGEKYWLARNSYGTYWGQNGFFKIIRGKHTHNLRIEEDCSFPVIDSKHYVEHFRHEPGINPTRISAPRHKSPFPPPFDIDPPKLTEIPAQSKHQLQLQTQLQQQKTQLQSSVLVAETANEDASENHPNLGVILLASIVLFAVLYGLYRQRQSFQYQSINSIPHHSLLSQPQPQQSQPLVP